MVNTNATTTDSRSQIHSEVRRPMESMAIGLVWFVFGVIEVLIAIRFVLLLLGANAEAGFVSLIYALSGIFMAPFNAILESQSVEGAMFEWSALVAIAVYALVAWGIAQLIRALSPRRQAATVDTSVRDDNVRLD